MRILTATVATVVLAFASLNYGATVYKCKEASGTTIFSDRPCAADDSVSVEVVPAWKMRANTVQGATVSTPEMDALMKMIVSGNGPDGNKMTASGLRAYRDAAINKRYDDLAELMKRTYGPKSQGNLMRRLIELERDRHLALGMENAQRATSPAEDRRARQEADEDADRKARPGVINPINHGLTNPVTGEFLAPAGPGYVGTRDGRYYAPAGPNGIIDTRTGQFFPVH